MMNAFVRNAVWLFAALACSSVSAQSDYPAKSVQLVICYAPGGGLDVIGRIVAERLSRNLQRQVVVENRPGAGGNIGTAFVAIVFAAVSIAMTGSVA